MIKNTEDLIDVLKVATKIITVFMERPLKDVTPEIIEKFHLDLFSGQRYYIHCKWDDGENGYFVNGKAEIIKEIHELLSRNVDDAYAFRVYDLETGKDVRIRITEIELM